MLKAVCENNTNLYQASSRSVIDCVASPPPDGIYSNPGVSFGCRVTTHRRVSSPTTLLQPHYWLIRLTKPLPLQRELFCCQFQQGLPSSRQQQSTVVVTVRVINICTLIFLEYYKCVIANNQIQSVNANDNTVSKKSGSYRVHTSGMVPPVHRVRCRCRVLEVRLGKTK